MNGGVKGEEGGSRKRLRTRKADKVGVSFGMRKLGNSNFPARKQVWQPIQETNKPGLRPCTLAQRNGPSQTLNYPLPKKQAQQ
jgi:hypothetical protein